MYDWPEVRPSWDRLWVLARDILIAHDVSAPDMLTHVEDYQPIWTNPDLIVGQTCGWPFISRLRDQVVPFARFDFSLHDLAPGQYQSVFLTRQPCPFEDLLEIGKWIREEAPVVAVNDLNSQSGNRVFGECFEQYFEIPPEAFVLSGSHRNSIRMLASGKADLCAVDAVSWRFALTHEPAAQEVHIAGRSNPVPGLPLITAKGLGIDPQELYAAVKLAIEELPSDDRECLGLHGLVVATEQDYQILLGPPYNNLRLAA